MNRTVKIIGAGVLLLAAIQFFPRDHNEGKAPTGKTMADAIPVPSNVQVIFKRSCYDCHSDHTTYPWYAQLQPVRYILDGHIRHGKDDLNFDEFGDYAGRRQRSRVRAIGESLEEGTMPLSSYTIIHRGAILTKEDKATLLNWAKETSSTLP
ncbi:heme-binding domain-containing protein [Mucilaginibacter sp. 44-25]|uniref:heme-binding domain-containing protein n=1 Tax=Mucilaginibacter sp. 44-25 TaxID=1895794 RepID=UPI000B0D5B35|nr:heme-binding domain-containing protein [Mucilaginibacter sp. 44-25]